MTLIQIETAFGTISVDINEAAAPLTSSNFLGYVDAGLYNGGIFHRVVTVENNSNANLKAERIGEGIDPSADRTKLPNDAISIEVIQGGIDPTRSSELGEPVPLERTVITGLNHLDGVISMARLTPDSAVSDFFICINDQPTLDFGGMRNPDGQGFAAFGIVTEGMDIARTIQTQPADGQSLQPPVTITSIRRV
jgi:peptidyl-prolyl cis-trans isomerase A (cyclophilin A)